VRPMNSSDDHRVNAEEKARGEEKRARLERLIAEQLAALGYEPKREPWLV